MYFSLPTGDLEELDNAFLPKAHQIDYGISFGTSLESQDIIHQDFHPTPFLTGHNLKIRFPARLWPDDSGLKIIAGAAARNLLAEDRHAKTLPVSNE